jgi:hypothetical protein
MITHFINQFLISQAINILFITKLVTMQTTYKYDGKVYISCTSLRNSHPGIFHATRNDRELIKKHSLKKSDYTFFRLTKGEMINTDGSSKRTDKLYIRKKWFNNKEPEIQKAPEIIHLEDTEKFKDDKGNIIEIETRGNRNADECYFKVKDVSEGFKIPGLLVALLKKDSKYREEIHYTYFSCECKNTNAVNKNTNAVNKNTNAVNKKANKKVMFLTYLGLLRVLFTTRNNKTEPFVKWASQTLFAAQMGTIEQKQEVAAQIIGTTYEVIKTVFSKTSFALPVVYLVKIGLAKDIKKVLDINNTILKGAYVYKFGFTNDVKRRMYEHDRDYTKLTGQQPELIYYQYIDPQYLSDAETDLKNFFNDFNFSVDNDKHKELVLLTNKKLKNIKKQYDLLGKSYRGNLSEMICKLKECENEIELLKKDNELLQEKITTANVKLERANMKIELLEAKHELSKLKNK